MSSFYIAIFPDAFAGFRLPSEPAGPTKAAKNNDRQDSQVN